MAYEIGHKSQNECLIKYVVDENSGSHFWFELFAVIFVLMALASGIDLLIIIIGFAILAMALVKLKPRRGSFEIELNRKKNLISIKSNKPGVAALRTYPLENFKGFGRVEIPRSMKNKSKPIADLFLEFDDEIDERFISAKNSLLNRAELKTEHDGELFWQVPIHKIRHHTPLDNADTLIAAVDSWLGPKTIALTSNEAASLIRDTRELEDDESSLQT